MKLSEELKEHFYRMSKDVFSENDLIKEAEALENQIEQMKCCENCQWKSHYTSDESIGCESFEYDGTCGWKLKEDE